MQSLKIAEKVEQIHTESPDRGYRRINDDLRHDHHIHVNDKRILRICRAKSIKFTIKYSNHGCTRQTKNPQFVVGNLLDRDFHHKLEKAGMTQSMSRVAKCIDNRPMEGFWGILKRERNYGRRFTSKKEL